MIDEATHWSIETTAAELYTCETGKAWSEADEETREVFRVRVEEGACV